MLMATIYTLLASCLAITNQIAFIVKLNGTILKGNKCKD